METRVVTNVTSVCSGWGIAEVQVCLYVFNVDKNRTQLMRDHATGNALAGSGIISRVNQAGFYDEAIRSDQQITYSSLGWLCQHPTCRRRTMLIIAFCGICQHHIGTLLGLKNFEKNWGYTH